MRLRKYPPHKNTSFQRLWHGFLSARAVVALVLLLLQIMGQALGQNADKRLLLLCGIYFVATMLTRIVAAPRPPLPHNDLRWFPLLGVDLVIIGLLQWLQNGNFNYTPLFGIPILMASVLGSLVLALGTSASATLMMLGAALWRSLSNDEDATPQYFQAALTGAGYFVVAYLTHQLALRLEREQQLARQSQRKAREHIQVNALIIENLSDGVLVLSADCKVRTANPAALLLLGGPQHTDTNFALTELAAWEPLCAMVHSTFATQEPHSADVSLLHPGEGPTGLRVRTWLTAVHGSAGGARCVMFLHDLRELEARLRTEKLAAMGRMSAAVAHEIRNPLTAIVQANALLSEDLQDPTQQRLCTMVRHNAERLQRTTEEILDIVRVQSQISHTPATTLVLDDVVAHIVGDWQSQAPAQRPLLLHLSAGVTPVEFDAEHLRRVLVNLLDNALRFLQGEPDSLQVHTHTDANSQVRLQVWSDGAPLDPSVQRHLFEPFFSSHSRNSGLGLFICRELCERHGATLSYQRVLRPSARGDISGNAFDVTFRSTVTPSQPAGLSDTLVV